MTPPPAPDPVTLTDRRAQIDTGNMYALIRHLPQHWQEGLALAEAFGQGLRAADFRQVLVLGMGGSAIGGDLLRAYAGPEAPVPVLVNRSYTVPAFVGPHTLVVASSYSGDTEETLTACKAAQEAGAQMVAVTTGGHLLDLAQASGWPHVQLPGGMPPRAALAYSFSALLQLARNIGLVTVSPAEIEETTRTLEAMAVAMADLTGNEAQRLALTLHDFLPILYSGTDTMDAVNLRWRCQFQENAKAPAYGNCFPELNHNEIEAWRAGAERNGQHAVVVLHDPEDHPRVQRRMAVTRDLVHPEAGAWLDVHPRGTCRLTRMLSMVYLGDWVSYYLALYRQADPTPIPNISALKAQL